MMSQIYIFTATNWQNVALAPALEFGPVDHVVVLVCERGGRFAADDAIHARESVRRFVTAYQVEARRLGRNTNPSASAIRGPVESVAFWRRELAARLADVENGSTVVLNYLAGPTDAKIGAWLALDDLARARPDLIVRRLSYGPQSRLLWRETDGAEASTPLKQAISLAAWMALRGRHEPAGYLSLRQEGESTARAYGSATVKLGRLCFAHSQLPSGWLVDLLSMLEPKRNEQNLAALVSANKFLKRLPGRAISGALNDLIDVIGELTPRFTAAASGGLVIRSIPPLIKYLRSAWFEEWVYIKLCERVGSDRLALNLKAEIDDPQAGADSTMHGSAANELDVAVLGPNQLHAVECKAFSRRAKSPDRQKWIDQCARVRNELVGPGGFVIGCSTVPLPDNSLTRLFAKGRGIGLATSLPEIDAALDRVAEACQ